MSRLQQLSDDELQRAMREAQLAYWQAWVQTATVDELKQLLQAIEERQARPEGEGGPIYQDVAIT